MQKSKILILCIFLILENGCSLFLGNIRPVEEKSDSYTILNLPERNSDWVKIDPAAASNSNEYGISDLVYQSKHTGSVISLNSACKSSQSTVPKHDLRKLTRELILGISNITQKNEENLFLNQVPALQTTIEGILNQKKMTLRTVVIQYKNCIYDLMYIATPENFSQGEKDFSIFAHSLKFR